MAPARLASLAYELAATPVADAELARELGIGCETVTAYGRDRLRCFAPDGTGPADLAASAANTALVAAGLSASAVEFVIFATNTPDYTFPGSACLLQAKLGCQEVGCLDVRAMCSGFVVGLDLARRYVATGTYRNVLLACGEVPSHQVRFDGVDPALACLTADAACAAVITNDSGAVIAATHAEVDGSRHRAFWCEFPASRHMSTPGVRRGERLTRAAVEDGSIYPVVDLDGLRALALERLPAVCERALAEACLDHVDTLIVAHLDPRTEAELADVLGKRAGRVIRPDVLYAYGASLPLALARARERGDIGAGETVALATAGAGASWSAAVLRP